MEPLARWIRKEANREVPWPLLVILGLAVLPCGAIPALALFPNQNSNAAFSIVLILFLATAGVIPTALYIRRNRHRPKMGPLIRAYAFGRLEETIGPRAADLNQAAADLEQITVALQRYADGAIRKKDVIRVAESRMRRMLELAIGAPANYGLSQEAASRQIEADGDWLEHGRRVCERLAMPIAERKEDDTLLTDLLELAVARDQAIEELELRRRSGDS